MKSLKKILVPIDFSDASRRALDAAVGLSARLGGTVAALHVVEPLRLAKMFKRLDLPEYTEKATAMAKTKLGDFLESTCGGHAASIERIVVPARRVSKEILIQSGDDPENLIVMGTAGRTGLGKFLLGSVAEEVLLRASCPVLTVTDEGAPAKLAADAKACLPVKTILVPTDFSEVAHAGLEAASALAVAFGAEVHVLHTLDARTREALEPLFADEKESLNKLFAEALEDARKAVHTEAEDVAKAVTGGTPKIQEHVSEGDPRKEIARLAEELHPDLIVMGSKGRASHTKNLFGSIAAYVVRACSQPVLTIRVTSDSD